MGAKNVPLTREQVKALPVLKDSEGKPIPCYVPEYPSHRVRRAELRPASRSRNRKKTKARWVQRAEVTYRTPVLKDGKPTGKHEVTRTGYFKNIYHKVVPSRKARALDRILSKVKDDPIKEAGELSKHAKQNS